jgi:hypothetical protein
MEEQVSEKSKMGKKSRAKGQRFELKVRADLEKKEWIVNKWTNTIDYEKNKIVPAKRKYNPFLKTLTIGTGFPDFVCFKRIKEDEETIEGTAIPEEYEKKNEDKFDVIGLEVKGNGYLDQIEKGMCFWLLENKIFSKILIARKGKKAGEISYIDFKEKYHKE